MIDARFANLERYVILVDIKMNYFTEFQKTKFVFDQNVKSLKLLFYLLFHKHCQISDSIIHKTKIDLIARITFIVKQQMLSTFTTEHLEIFYQQEKKSEFAFCMPSLLTSKKL